MNGLDPWKSVIGHRPCGACTLCCKLPAIDDPALRKPANTHCRYCAPGVGCAVHADRPASCRAFQCLWSQLPAEADPLPESWRPDLVDAYLIRSADGNDLHVMADPAVPDGWRRGTFGSALRAMAGRNAPSVLVQIGRTFLWLSGVDGEIREIVGIASLDAEGRIFDVAFRVSERADDEGIVSSGSRFQS